MANPFLVLGGISVGVVTAAFGVLQVPGWVASAQDASAVNDLSLIRESQSAQLASHSTFTPDLTALTDGSGGTAFSLDGVTITYFGVSDEGDAFCAAIRSDSGHHFATSDKGITTDAAADSVTAIDDAGCAPETRVRVLTDDQIVFRVDTAAAGCVAPGIHLSGGFGTIEWGDGKSTAGTLAAAQHTYGTPGTYDIVVTGMFEETGLMPAGAAPCLIDVPHWGSGVGTKHLDHAFDGATNLVSVATPPRGITSMARTFAGATSFNQSIDGWDVSRVTNMSALFAGATTFNQPLASWQTGQLRYAGGIFMGATAFDQPIGVWDMSNVVDLSNAFNGASAFNQPLPWNVGNVKGLSWMFSGAWSFGQDLSAWSNHGFAAHPTSVDAGGFMQGSKLTAAQLPSWWH